MTSGAAASLAGGRTAAARLPAPLRKAARLLIALAATAVVWEGAVQLFGIRPVYLPRLSAILMSIASTPQAYIDGLLRTSAETLTGFVAGGAFGVITGIAFFRLRALKDMVFPIFVVSQTIPVIAFGALVVLWFGNTLLAKAVIAFYLTFFPVTVNVLRGLQTIDPDALALMRAVAAPPRQVFLKLRIPAAAPYLFTALRISATASVVGAIIGELPVGSRFGMGVVIINAAQYYNWRPANLWAAILVSSLLGIGFYHTVAAVERVSLRGRPAAQAYGS